MSDQTAAPRVAQDVEPDPRTPAAIAREWRDLLASGHALKVAGLGRHWPEQFARAGYTPRHCLDIFDVRVYLTALRREDQFRFFVAYVRPAKTGSRARPALYPRIFYKDSSLVWRCASHLVIADDERWIGKGAVKPVAGEPELYASAEETTDLPYEMQSALDSISRRDGAPRPDRRALDWVLRRAPPGRIEPYADFTRPRAGLERAVNDGKPVAAFLEPNDPASLRFAPGFAPDLASGPVSVSESRSSLYGGAVVKRRFLSENGDVQYLIIAAPRQVWLIPPQSLTRRLTTYALRPIDVPHDDRLCLPGYEFHYEGHTQIPDGYAGAASAIDPSRADTSPWNEGMPIVQAFRARYGAVPA
ncbi:MAG: hypothetical protein AAF610_12705 [Pseudomonadota bacterium]